ncbi:uncharacterized protein LOC134532126 isoform X2 [Bacillus rossius redtenbacheri]|uniref:uncharacterized protein LOC134532126 isoform X2 n=1 Tax=Bacillus rossius redtenbacheri TaxID=93214 RepID=UPI002FDD8004
MGNIVNKVLLCVGGGRRRKWRPAPSAAPSRRRERTTTLPVFTKTENECCAMSPTPPLPVTEDTPPDMLAGSMDLQVVLPSGNSVKMSVERSTPMMDLLVQVTTANKLAPGSHVLQALGDRGVLPYKPSTPIGTLDTWTIHVVPKSRLGSASSKKAPLKPSNQQPFEQTFRLQVHLPRNQLFVTRTSSKSALADILRQVCGEKNLDPAKYELRHPGNLDEVLQLGASLADYRLQEVVLAAKSRPLSASHSTADIMVLHREEENRRQQARSGSSSTSSRLFGVFKRNRSSAGEGSVSSDSLGGRSVSPSHSDESVGRSASPPAPGPPSAPSRPQRKRRPAPAPPVAQQQVAPAQQGSSNKGEKGALMSHSRNSSDSSGYHEASVLSESPDSHSGPQTFDSGVDSLPRRSKLTQPATMGDHSHALSRSLSSLAARAPGKPSALSASTTALCPPGQVPKKKRAAPPPPKTLVAAAAPEDQVKTSSLDRHPRDKDVAAPEKCASLPAAARLSRQEGSVSSFDSASKVSLRSASSTEEEEEDQPPSAPAPAPPPRAPSPQLAPPVEPQPVAIPTPTPRARLTASETPAPRAPAPVPRPRRMSLEKAGGPGLEATVGGEADARHVVAGKGEVPREVERRVADVCPDVAVFEDHSASTWSDARLGRDDRPGSVKSDDGLVKNRSVTRDDDDVAEDDGAGEVRQDDHAESTESDRVESDAQPDFLVKDRSASVLSDTASVESSVFGPSDSEETSPGLGHAKMMSKMKSDTDAVRELLRNSRASERPHGRPSGGSFTSLRSMDDLPQFLSDAASIGRWGSVEALDEADEATRQSARTSEDESDAEVSSADDCNFVESKAVGRLSEVMEPQPASQVESATVAPAVTERLPKLPEPVVPTLPEDGKEEPLDIDWEYQLPAPPSAFRDRASPSIVEGGTVPLEDARAFQEAEESVDSGDFSLTDVAERPKARKSLDDFSVRIGGGEITRVNPLYDSRRFDGRPTEDAAESSLPGPEPTSVEDDADRSFESKEDATGRKLSEALDREVFTDSKPRSHSVGVTDVFQPHQLSNFKISTYQGRRDIDSIFREAEAESSAVRGREFKEPLPASKNVRRYGSANSLAAVQTGAPGRDEADSVALAVKRSVSHVSLGPGRPASGQEVRRSSSSSRDHLRGELVHGGDTVPKDEPRCDTAAREDADEKKSDAPFQSLQVLRTILPHMIHSQVAEDVNISSSTNQESERRAEPVSESAAAEGPERRYRYQGPPAVKLSSWSERPKVKVGIRQDSDYRIGREAGAGAKEEPDAEVKQTPPPKVEQTPLSMRLVSDAPVRKGLSTSQILQSISHPDPSFGLPPPPARTSVLVGRTHADPSRIPIVRAVELKKPFQQQLQSRGGGVSISIVRRDEEVLVGGERVDGPAKDGVFAGVNSLARMFSAGTLRPYKSPRPTSAYEPGDGGARRREELAGGLDRSSSVTNLSPSVTVNSSESSAPRKYTSVVGVNKPGPGSSVVKVNGFSGAPVVKGFRLASQPPASVRIEHRAEARVQRSESALVKGSTLARDPLPAVVRVHEKQSLAKTRSLPGPEAPPPPADPPRPKNSAVAAGDFRGQLMEAIRSHGGRDALNKTHATDVTAPNVIFRF